MKTAASKRSNTSSRSIPRVLKGASTGHKKVVKNSRPKPRVDLGKESYIWSSSTFTLVNNTGSAGFYFYMGNYKKDPSKEKTKVKLGLLKIGVSGIKVPDKQKDLVFDGPLPTAAQQAKVKLNLPSEALSVTLGVYFPEVIGGRNRFVVVTRRMEAKAGDKLTFARHDITNAMLDNKNIKKSGDKWI